MALITEDLVIPPVSVLFPKTRRHFDHKPCGTVAAYRRHKRYGEKADRSCLQANARAANDYRSRVRANGGKLLGGRWPKELHANGSAELPDGVDCSYE